MPHFCIYAFTFCLHSFSILFNHSLTVLLKSCTHAGATAIFNGFSEGASSIWLDNVQCNGNESNLIDCPANQIGRHNCDHSEDAGVNCSSRCILCNIFKYICVWYSLCRWRHQTSGWKFCQW